MGQRYDCSTMPIPSNTLPMPDVRVNVRSRVQLNNAIAGDDILNPAATNDNIIRALDVITAPSTKPGYEKIGHGWKIIITSAHSDHHDDGNLGPHGHNPHGGPGWAVDFVPANDPALTNAGQTIELLRQLIAENPFVTKVGCPKVYAENQTLRTKANACGVVLFTDVGTGPHIHIQSAENSLLANLHKVAIA
jgi:hypothetical protein